MAQHRTVYVDPVNGLDTNDGLTKAAAYKTLLHASRDSNTATMVEGDSLTILVAPTLTLATDAPAELVGGDHLRMNPTTSATGFNGGTMIVRCWQDGAQFYMRPDGANPVIYVIGDGDGMIDIDDCNAVVENVLLTAGLSTDVQLGPRLKIGSNCTFAKKTTASGLMLSFDSNAKRAALDLQGGRYVGWNRFCDATFESCIVKEIEFDATGSLGGGESLIRSNGRFEIEDNVFNFPDPSTASPMNFRAINTTLEFHRNTLILSSSSTAMACRIYGTTVAEGGSQAWYANVTGNRFFGNLSGAPIELGGGLISDTSANNKAPWTQTSGLLFERNTVTNDNVAGRLMNIYNGSNGAQINDNYMRQGIVGQVTNVHGVYVYAEDVTVTNNRIQGQIMCFNPGIKIDNNIIVAALNQAILLGGNAGGSTVQGGGNDYCITNNVLVGEFAALDDYAWNGAYPTNLGELVATIDNNIYLRTDLSTAGPLRLDGTYYSSSATARTKWATWGNAGNATNSQFDYFGDSELLRSIDLAVVCNAGKLTSQSLAEIGTRSRTAGHVAASRKARDWSITAAKEASQK